MFKKTMKFDDLEGNEVTQTFHFNFTKLEIAELVEFGAIQKFADPDRKYLPLEEQMAILSTPIEESGLTQRENNQVAYNIFQDLILDSFGVKGEDNVSFNKTPELRHYWSTHVAFVEMIFEFLESPALANEFIEKCLPAKLVARAKSEMAIESGKKVDVEDLVAEASRRQANPETRIQPGLASVPEPVKPNAPREITVADIEIMGDDEFRSLNPKDLSPEVLMAAFRRKTTNNS